MNYKKLWIKTLDWHNSIFEKKELKLKFFLKMLQEMNYNLKVLNFQIQFLEKTIKIKICHNCQ